MGSCLACSVNNDFGAFCSKATEKLHIIIVCTVMMLLFFVAGVLSVLLHFVIGSFPTDFCFFNIRKRELLLFFLLSY